MPDVLAGGTRAFAEIKFSMWVDSGVWITLRITSSVFNLAEKSCDLPDGLAAILR